ncbi:GPW/gp25 family protein [Natrialbaceae archaeon AArc-T1-2]|uniref:GPW/gp25 family protein n=1 Tax=Natrialbaceae archaeon AArc-T1-2 TaxID=3053904 RepID=UPI00255AD103|nr:GPW/gp25 family protein [Natrialbaceae archaeon AArc-T1-2]WIV66073.1 GPW/gp25 family protein [Natrialbaceae archaeon AArc-T1-2]
MTRTPDSDHEFLGRGWAFPVATTSGDVDLASGERTIEESIRVIIGTAKGERIMRPDFGCRIHEYVFETIDTSTKSLIETAVEDALVEWEPRIDVENVTVSTDRLSTGELMISVDYTVRDTNNEHNLVYPFYVGSERS